MPHTGLSPIPSTSYGELLRDRRRYVGLTQAALAESAGISPRSISEMERGAPVVPRRDTLERLVAVLGFSDSERDRFKSLVQRTRQARLETSAYHARAQPIQSLSHNLPRALTSFVGREHAMAKLSSTLRTASVLTLTGRAGVGKSRLAVELARTQLANYAGGVRYVDVASLNDGASLADAVGIPDRTKRVLLVLDNCEHVLGACARVVADVLRACPEVSVLMTSRQPLGIAGEHAWLVPPLEVRAPDDSEVTAAARLFVDRARAVSNRELSVVANARSTARICRAVGGVPLALELAAARTSVLTLAELADRLEHDAGVLSSSRSFRRTACNTSRSACFLH